MKYQPPYAPGWPDVPDPNAPYINGNPPAGIKGSVPPASAFEYPQREIVNLIQKGGHSPSDDDLFQLTKSARRALYRWGVDTGSANSLSIALDPPLTSYGQGLMVLVLVAHDNTGATTIRINGLTTQQIVKKDGSSLFSGDLKAGGVALLVYDGGHFQLASGAAGSTTITGGWYNGADWIVDIGPVNHIQGSPPIVPTAYAAGLVYSVLVANTNTGPVDINVSALGIKQVFLPNGEPLAGGDIVAGMVIRVIYDGTRFTMISKIHMEIIDTAVTMIVGPNAGADFPDLYAAMAWAKRRRIDNVGTLTFTLQGQTTGSPVVHNYANDLIIEHPDGARLTIGCAAVNNIPQYSGFHGAAASGGFYPGATANLNYLRTCFQADLRFATGKGIICRSKIGMLKNFMISGPALSSSGCTGITINGDAIINCVAAAYCWPNCWGIGPAASLDATNIYAVGGQGGITLSFNSTILVRTGIMVSCNIITDGLQGPHGSVMSIAAGNPHIFDCGGWGANLWGSSTLHMAGAEIDFCGNGGVLCTSASCWLSGTNVLSGQFGFVCSTGGQMDCSGTNTSSISSGDYTAAHGAFMYAQSYQNGAAQFTPARNTVGNGNAYIEA